jgi:hypothetical protein
MATTKTRAVTAPPCALTKNLVPIFEQRRKILVGAANSRTHHNYSKAKYG